MTVATSATPTEAHLLKETLVAAGLPARVADANFVQANPWMSNAVGGVRVMVPASHADEARKTLASFQAGDFQLDEQTGTPGAEIDDKPRTGERTHFLYSSATRKPAVVAVKKGFSWSAFMVGPLWFLLNGMWLTFLLSLTFTWGAPLAIRTLGEPGTSSGAVVQLLVFSAYASVWVFAGWVANFLLAEELKQKGYQLDGPVRARSTGEAIDTHRPTAVQPVSAPR